MGVGATVAPGHDPDGLAPLRQTLADLLATFRGEAGMTQQQAGDLAATRQILGEAAEAFSRAGDSEPAWTGGYGLGHLRHDEGRCYANLGLGAQAAQAAGEAVQVRSRDRHPRPHAFSLGIQAIGHAQAGSVDQACASGHQLLTLAAGLDSHRLRTRVGELLRALAGHAAEPAVRQLREAARPVLASPAGPSRP